MGNVLYDLRCDDLAGSAPGGEAVEDEQLVFSFQGLVEFGLATMPDMSAFVQCPKQVRGPGSLEPGRESSDATHVDRLWTPSLPILAVFAKNLGVSMGSKSFVRVLLGFEDVAVGKMDEAVGRRRADVSRVLRSKVVEGSMLYVGEVRHWIGADFKDCSRWNALDSGLR